MIEFTCRLAEYVKAVNLSGCYNIEMGVRKTWD